MLKLLRINLGVKSLILLMIVGVLLAIGGLFLLFTTYVDGSWVRVPATVVDNVKASSDESGRYIPVVEYSADGTTFRVRNIQSTSAPLEKGSKQTIAYNPNSPGEATIVQTGFFAVAQWILIVLGVGAILVGILGYRRNVKREAALDELYESGQKLRGVLIGVESVPAKKADKYKMVVAAIGPNGAVTRYLGDTMRGSYEAQTIDFRAHRIPVDVYVDTMDPAHYYVDTSNVSKLTSEELLKLSSQQVVGQPPSSSTPSNQQASS